MRIVSTIEARMGSTRLPEKTIKEMVGKPMLELIIERLKRARKVDEIVVATTTEPEDEVIAELAERVGVKWFRGSSEDVLDRVIQAAKVYKADIIVEMTGDNPLLEPQLVDEAIDIYLKGNYDYVSNAIKDTYPDGLNVQAFSVKVLDEVARITNDPADRENVSLYIYEHPEEYRLYNMEAPAEYYHPEYRWTIDTEEDFQFTKAVYENLYYKNPDFSIADIMKLLKEKPDLLKINAHIEQKPVR
ncbi:MAG: spore coat biosynthesis protein F [Dehalococcoidales bacterium]|jgi:spore coat polysaccharide biosynthesis protein SpsF|nr:spore coat biosynthesis protein F [Dehalococcoidales bacterium]|tara:strand:- start:64 stop:798 length:735 start_codon:yes stop_codon:yes gene_type:complete